MDEIKKLPVWLVWKKQFKRGKNGESGWTKVPFTVKGEYAATDNPETWGTFDELWPSVVSGEFDGMGIVFERTAGVIGIDLDHCVEEGEVDEDFLPLIEKAATYTEYSPSGTGVHMLFRAPEQINLLRNKKVLDKSTKKAIEVYSWGRFFTFTEDEMRCSQEIRTVSEAELVDILQIAGYPWGTEAAEEANVPVENKNVFSDEELLRRMFSAKNGDRVKALYDGDLSEHDEDASSGDHALCSHLAFWSQRDFAQIERLWLSSPLGQREKTQKRKEYRTRTINSAIQKTQEVYNPHPAPEDIEYNFIEVEKGTKDDKYMVPAMIFVNIARVLRHHPALKGKFRLNDFSHMTETCFNRSEWVSLNDAVIYKVREIISEEFRPFMTVGKEMITDAIIHVAAENAINPPKDYVESLVWDKVPRLNSWLYNAYGTPDDELHQSIGSNWLKGLVRRIMVPGCQFDEVLALESPQGWRKSTSVRVLGQPWHVETTHSIDNKDFYLLIAQNVIVEFSEGEIFDRASVNKIKAEITKTEDQVRPPYERGIMRFKRSCVFAITTNKLELKDDTGNRRWLPVQLQKPADIEWLTENRDQLYAEAYYRVFVGGETSHEYPTDQLQQLQKSRTEYSEDEEAVALYCAGRPEESLNENGVSLKELIAACYPNSEKNNLHERVFPSHLRKLGFENRASRVGGFVAKRWFPTEKTHKILEDIRAAKYGSLELDI